MSTAVRELAEFVAKATEEFRLGPEVTTHDGGNLRVTEVYAMPPVSEARTATVDVGFIVVGFTEHAAHRDGFLRLLKAATRPGVPGEFGTAMDAEEILGGPSYITTGAWLGSQDLALRLYALLEHYGLAEVMLPRKLGITGAQERELMGSGMVMFEPKQELTEVLG